MPEIGDDSWAERLPTFHAALGDELEVTRTATTTLRKAV
jgi:hypothetical protein